MSNRRSAPLVYRPERRKYAQPGGQLRAAASAAVAVSIWRIESGDGTSIDVQQARPRERATSPFEHASGLRCVIICGGLQGQRSCRRSTPDFEGTHRPWLLNLLLRVCYHCLSGAADGTDPDRQSAAAGTFSANRRRRTVCVPLASGVKIHASTRPTFSCDVRPWSSCWYRTSVPVCTRDRHCPIRCSSFA